MSETAKNTTRKSAEAEEVREAVLNEVRQKLQGIVDDARKGTYELAVPLLADGSDIKALKFDFGALTGWEFVDAMDKAAPAKPAAEGISAQQALYLFAVAAAKVTEHVDAEDIMERLSMEDAIKATQIGQLFFKSASRLGNLRITNA